ncbi:MAG: hypothetical protein NPIRA01_02600 [Nitrospirales bacterium]|nr:MAG: hypothetical protein NPIRA01_02600 [Nitrospirales bacterium]
MFDEEDKTPFTSGIDASPAAVLINDLHMYDCKIEIVYQKH